MTPEQIVAMAREAGFVSASYHGLYMSRIERFAQLVAAYEREACAKLCEDRYNSPDFNDEAIECADAIRARGEK